MSVARDATSGTAGTNWTVNVTDCNLSNDVTVKDFLVLFNGVVNPNSNFTKNSATLITYTGVALAGATTVVVQRNTPISRVAELQYRTVVTVRNWEDEFNRVHRVLNEYELNGVGATSIPSFGSPSDGVFSAAWDGDTVQTATRNALYDILATLAPIASPTFTGDPKVPTAADAENDTTAASTQWVRTRVANTLASSPALAGSPTATTPAVGSNDTSVATTAFANTMFRPIVEAQFVSAAVNFAHNTVTDIVYTSEITDANGCYSNGTGELVVPAGCGGRFLVFAGWSPASGLNNEMYVDIWVDTGGGYVNSGVRIAHARNQGGDSENQVYGMAMTPLLLVGHKFKLRGTQTNVGTAVRNCLASNPADRIHIIHIPSTV